MARQTINRGTTANDGTGDTLRTAAQKINENFEELFLLVAGGDSAITSVRLIESGLSFEGLTEDDFETKLVVAEPTADRTLTMPDHTGIIIVDTATQTLTNKTLTTPTLATPKIKDGSGNYTYNVTVGTLGANRNIALPALSAGDTFVMANATQTLTNKTMSLLTLNQPKLGGLSGGGLILDSAGNGILQTETVASAVNRVAVRNAAAGGEVQIYSTGTDTNVDLNIATKGSGAIEIDSRLVLMTDTTHTNASSIDTVKPVQIFDQGSPISVTLPDGSTFGETVYFIGKGSATVTVNVTSLVGGSSIAFSTGDAAQLIWDGANWQIISNSGTVA